MVAETSTILTMKECPLELYRNSAIHGLNCIKRHCNVTSRTVREAISRLMHCSEQDYSISHWRGRASEIGAVRPSATSGHFMVARQGVIIHRDGDSRRMLSAIDEISRKPSGAALHDLEEVG